MSIQLNCFEGSEIENCFNLEQCIKCKCLCKKRKKRKRSDTIGYDVVLAGKQYVAKDTNELKSRDVLISKDKIGIVDIIEIAPDMSLIRAEGERIKYFIPNIEDKGLGFNIIEYWNHINYFEMTIFVETILKKKYPQMKMKLLPTEETIRLYGSFSTNKESRIDNIRVIIDKEETVPSDMSHIIAV